MTVPRPPARREDREMAKMRDSKQDDPRKKCNCLICVECGYSFPCHLIVEINGRPLCPFHSGLETGSANSVTIEIEE